MNARRQDHRQIRLLMSGRKALALRKQGMAPMDILMVIGGSRARMYKAMHAAEREALEPLVSIDPLLL
jgi:hypothetical protein